MARRSRRGGLVLVGDEGGFDGAEGPDELRPPDGFGLGRDVGCLRSSLVQPTSVTASATVVAATVMRMRVIPTGWCG